jgi:hypothetical protein
MLKKQMENKMAKETYTNKSQVEIHGVKPGADFVIDCDENGTPKDLKWRRRVRDAEIDGCIEKKVKTTKKKKEDS